jgi:hypothetical protein
MPKDWSFAFPLLGGEPPENRPRNSDHPPEKSTKFIISLMYEQRIFLLAQWIIRPTMW